MYADNAGVWHFEDLSFELTSKDSLHPSTSPLRSPCVKAYSRTSGPGGTADWHVAPARQFFMLLAGALEVEISDGETCHLEPGAITLLGEVTGEGHGTRLYGEEDVRGIFLQLPT